MESKAILMLSELEKQVKETVKKVTKEIKRHEKIMARSDKRQQKEYDELQKQLETVKNLQNQLENLLDSFIKVLAEAIDKKSKYTGKHCERVPKIAMDLCKIASEDTEIFKDFTITPQELREVEIAGWLHDIGKVTTPEFVMDKSVRLETIYNRIHEIRTRFEVILRDLEIEALKRKLNKEDEKKVDEWLEKEKKKLFEEFEFIAKLNQSEFVKDEDIEKLKKIAKREWIRNFDILKGLSWEEENRIKKTTPKTPSKEKLLDDKEYHVIKRDKKELQEYKEFKMNIPENLYNFGEIYNLSIKKGTLTEEERFKIQEHIIMTIKMLEKLPFPEKYKNIPIYAENHHETMDATGYPRGIKASELPLPARIMAFADIFEALTAADRPYKKPKKISEAIKILYFMVKDNHLDKNIFKLFLKSGYYLEYAKKYLKPEQIDEVDINQYLEKL